MRYWTSDLHFGHQNIIDYSGRPFEDTDHMREMMVKWWNEIVSLGDEVWIVGDFAMGQIGDNLPVARRLNGRLVLIPGNHDRCWAGAGKSNHEKWNWLYDELFDVIDDFPNITHTVIGNKYEVQVCHFPRIENGESKRRHGDQYSPYRPDYEGLWLIHGHTHQTSQVDVANQHIHVGVDAWNYRPIPETQILEILENHGG